VEIKARTRVEMDFDALVVTPPEGRALRLALSRWSFEAVDAESCKRFVRMLRFEHGSERVVIVTPPEEGTIAPRCARLPAAPESALVVDRNTFETIDAWLASGGRLRSRTVTELARLAIAATSAYAVHIGEWAAQLAVEMTSDVCGPLRGCLRPREVLAPLEEAARWSERASEALVAALAKSSLLAT